jgi:DNA-binding LacI/PurR family transcriptional regulator
MHHLRMKHKPKFRSTIAAITTAEEETEPKYAALLREGARREAEALGYGFSLFRVAVGEKRDSSLHRILRARGVEGIMLLPMKAALKMDRFLDWKDFAVVAATYAVLAPDFHRVVPDQFGNTLLICGHLARLGCKRIGLIAWRGIDLVVDHRFSAAVMWQNTMGGTEFVPVFSYDVDYRDGLQAWFTKERPDGLIVGTESMARGIMDELKLRVPGSVRIAVTERPGPTLFSGIDQRSGVVGGAAVAQLHAMIQRGEKGPPVVPGVMTIKGCWMQAPRPGKSAKALVTR